MTPSGPLHPTLLLLALAAAGLTLLVTRRRRSQVAAGDLRPKVILHDPREPKEEAPILDLETVPELAIRRSLKPAQLPRDTLDYLSPRQRICYFFERAVSPDPDEAAA